MRLPRSAAGGRGSAGPRPAAGGPPSRPRDRPTRRRRGLSVCPPLRRREPRLLPPTAFAAAAAAASADPAPAEPAPAPEPALVAAARAPSPGPAVDWTAHRVGYVIMLAGPNITTSEADVRVAFKYSPWALGLRDGIAEFAGLPEAARPAPPYPFVTVTVEKGQKYALKGVECPGADKHECAYYEGFVSLPTKDDAARLARDLTSGDLTKLGRLVADATAARAKAQPEAGGGRPTLLTVAEVDGRFINKATRVSGGPSSI